MEVDEQCSRDDTKGGRCSSFDSLPPEDDMGNAEYKLKLCSLDEEKLSKRATQMRFRLNEGSGECFYYLGIRDDGSPAGLNEAEFAESVANLNKIAALIEGVVMELDRQIMKGKTVAQFLVREAETSGNYVSLTLGVVGNVDAGKSTTIGTLTKGVQDDGRGRARLHVFNHKHEITTGRTSSIGHQILGFDFQGEVVNSKTERPPTWQEIVAQSTKVVSFFDMAGHERYLKTTIYGLTTIHPDYALVLVGANMGVSHMTKEHMSLCLTLKIPFVVVVSKIDLVPPNILEENLAKINEICRKGARKTPYSIRSRQDVINCASNIRSDSIVPIIQISNVTGFNLDLLKMLLNVLPPRNDYTQNWKEPVELLVDNTYSVTGHPTIVSGMLRKGVINVGDSLCLGPYFDSSYKTTKVKSIHNKFRDVKTAKAGHYICLSLKGVTRAEIKKGFVLVADRSDTKVAVREFWAWVNVLHSPTTIKVGYQPMVHVDQVRQSVKIIEIQKLGGGMGGPLGKKLPPPGTTAGHAEGEGKGSSVGPAAAAAAATTATLPLAPHDANRGTADLSRPAAGMGAEAGDEEQCLRTGDKAHIRLRFMVKPEHVKPHMKMIFREGRVKAAGRVIEK